MPHGPEVQPHLHTVPQGFLCINYFLCMSVHSPLPAAAASPFTTFPSPHLEQGFQKVLYPQRALLHCPSQMSSKVPAAPSQPHPPAPCRPGPAFLTQKAGQCHYLLDSCASAHHSRQGSPPAPRQSGKALRCAKWRLIASGSGTLGAERDSSVHTTGLGRGWSGCEPGPSFFCPHLAATQATRAGRKWGSCLSAVIPSPRGH